MKASSKLLVIALTWAGFTASGWAGNSSGKDAAADPAPAAATASTPSTITSADVQALKDALAAQQLRIDRLTKQLELQQQMQQAQQSAEKVNATQAPIQQVAEVSPATAVQQETPGGGLNLQTQAPGTGDDNPMHSQVISIHFKGITITPGGFAEAAFVRRSRALAADLTTPFNSLTMPGATQSNMSEFFGSARQSRPTVYIDGRLSNVELSSYISGDFLSSGTSSTSTQTNSYTFRLRQVWGQAKFDNGWRFLGGQAWSLVTENKEGIQPSDDVGKTNDARPMTIDPGYTVGFTFARQYGIRVTKDFSRKVWFAVAMENPQGTLTTHNNTDNFVLGSEGATNSYNAAVSACTIGSYTATGATTPTYYTTCTPIGNYTFNPSPDLIAKIAFDPGFGHYEVFGLYDRFSDRTFPCANFALGTTGPCPNDPAKKGPSSIGATNESRNGGAFGANARWAVLDKHVVFGLHFFGGKGVGRYGAAQLSDLAARADGAPNPIKNGQGLATLEWHGKKLDLYSYAGAEYDGRTTDFDAATGEYVGYGSPHFNNVGCFSEAVPSIALTNGFNPGSLSKCTADTRVIREGTLGFWYRFYSGPRGRVQFGTQYSYVERNTWAGEGFSKGTTVAPAGIDNMVFTSFRYYLP